MSMSELIGLTGQERIDKLKELREIVRGETPPITNAPVLSEGLVSPEVKAFVEKADGMDLCNEEVPDATKQRAKNRAAVKQTKRTKNKHRSYWYRPTENRALGERK